LANSTVNTFGPGTTPGSGGTMPSEVRISYAKRMLIAARPKLVHAQFALDNPIDKNQGSTMQMRRFELIPPATTALVEGVTPNGSKLQNTPITVGVQQFGAYVTMSDVLTWTSIDPIMTGAADILGQQYGQTIDILARDTYALGTNVLYANAPTRTARNQITAADKITSAEIKKAARTLDKANVDKIDGAYVAIVSPDTKFDIESFSEWLAVKEYSDKEDLYKGELGMLFGIRFVESSLAKVFTGAGSGGIDVHGTLVFGANAFVKSSISGEAMKMIAKAPGEVGLDPLDQRAALGWKATFGSTIANQAFVLRIEHAVTP
jgi:N4-gp56 family major capsid protein